MRDSQTVARRIAFNTLAQGLGRLGNLALNFVAILALARYLGAAGYGTYIFIINFTTLFGLIGDFGISQVAVREMARQPASSNALLTMSAILRLALSLLAMLICGVLISWFDVSDTERVGVYLASGVFLLQALSSVNSVFQAQLAMHYDALTSFIARAVDTGLILLFMQQGCGLLAFVAVPLLSGLVGFALIGVIVARYFGVRPAWRFKWLPMLFREAWPIGLASVPVIIFFRADSLLLTALADNVSVGLYAAAQRPVEYLLVIVAPLLINSVYPLLSAYWPTQSVQFAQLYRRTFDVLMSFVVGVAVVAVVFAGPLVELLYSNQYADSAMPLRVLFVSAIFMFMGAYGARMLIAVNRQRLALFNEVVGAMVNVALNLWLIPPLGAVGSALAMLATVVVAGLLHLWAMYRATQVWPDATMQGRIVLAGIVSGILMWLAGQSFWWLGILCGLLVYPLCLSALRVITVHEALAIMRRKSKSQV